MIQASCHCGAVRLEIAHSPQSLTDCNCSICRRLGVLWAYYPLGAVTVHGEGEETQTYVWGDRQIAFHRCRTCGCVSHWRSFDSSRDRIGVNARLFDLADTEGVTVRLLDGARTERYLDET